MFSILLSKNKSNFKYYGINWGKTLGRLFGIKLRVVGRENFDSNKQYIFAPNHSSIIDFQILLLAVNQYCVFVAKKELAATFTNSEVGRSALTHGVFSLRLFA